MTTVAHGASSVVLRAVQCRCSVASLRRTLSHFERFELLQDLSPYFGGLAFPLGIKLVDAHGSVQERGIPMFALYGERAGPKLLIAGKCQRRLGLADAPILSDAHEKKSLSYIEHNVNINAPLESEAASDSS